MKIGNQFKNGLFETDTDREGDPEAQAQADWANRFKQSLLNSKEFGEARKSAAKDLILPRKSENIADDHDEWSQQFWAEMKKDPNWRAKVESVLVEMGLHDVPENAETRTALLDGLEGNSDSVVHKPFDPAKRAALRDMLETGVIPNNKKQQAEEILKKLSGKTDSSELNAKLDELNIKQDAPDGRKGL